MSGYAVANPTYNLPLHHAGQYYDSESGLFYNYFRYYNPKSGRYLRSDPIGLDGGLNNYGYVGGSPLNLVDQFGLEAEHTTNKTPSNRPKHEKSQARKQRDAGGEKGDARRRVSRKKPSGWKGPWPPKIIPFPLIINPCLLEPSLCSEKPNCYELINGHPDSRCYMVQTPQEDITQCI